MPVPKLSRMLRISVSQLLCKFYLLYPLSVNPVLMDTIGG